MPERTSYEPGTPSWVDLGTADIDKSLAFYGGLFGWDASEGDEAAGGYRNFLFEGKQVAGVYPLMNDQQPPVWATYFDTDDADAIAQRVKDNGGQVLMEPMDVMQFGRMAVFMDPTGAAFGVWQPNEHKGAQLVNEPGSLTWNELATRDADAAKAFYTAVFDLGTDDMDMGPMTYTVWKVGDDVVGGMMPMGDQFPAEVPPHWAVYFAVDDTDAVVAKAQELGAAVIAPPMDIPNVGRFAALADPNGTTFSIIKNAPQQQQG